MSQLGTVTRGAEAVRSRRRLSPAVRKTVLVLHIISSVGWLGLTIGNLVLAVTGLTTDSPVTQHAVYLVMGILGDLLLIPISLTAFVTGIVLSLGTPWGMFRYRWVIVKLVLTSIAVVMTPLSLLPAIHETIATVSNVPIDQLADVGEVATGPVFAACVSLSFYTTSVLLSVVKPWGRRGPGV